MVLVLVAGVVTSVLEVVGVVVCVMVVVVGIAAVTLNTNGITQVVKPPKLALILPVMGKPELSA